MSEQNHSRIHNSIVNLNFGIVAQLANSILGFVSRSVFIHILGTEYLGINGLYSSILNVLSLAELGLANVVTYSLYKPIADNDRAKLCALMNFYKTIYRFIAAAVGIIGIAIVPALDFLVQSDIDKTHLILYYLMFLANSVCSYLLVYKSSIINADQKQYIISKYQTIFKLLTTVLQVLLLVLLHNFTVYLAVQIGMTVANNLYISHKANVLYPFICEKGSLEKSEKQKIFDDVKSMFSYRVGGSLLNGTDNMYISALISTATVGIYSNYTMISGMISGFVGILYNSIFSSIGNLNASGTKEQKRRIFDVVSLAFTWIGSFCAVSLMVLYNDFISIWIGPRYILPYGTVAVIVLNFLLPIILYPIWSYRNTTGLFKETKNILLYAAILNLILSYFLGKYWGLVGILAATSISRFLTSFWYEPYVLFKKGFHASSWSYFRRQIIHAAIIAVSCRLVYLIADCISITNVYLSFTVKAFLCVIIPNGILLAVNYNTQEFKYLLNVIKRKAGR